jgi:polar amino acid transport system substrate-binding protein
MKLSRSGSRRAWLLLTALSVVASTFVGCGSGSSAPPSQSAAPTAEASAATDSSPGALLPQAIKDRGTLRIATDAPYPPWEMMVEEGSGELTGIDVDLGTAIAEKLGLRPQFSIVKFDGIIPALMANKYDVAMSAMIDNAERQAAVDFVDYAQDGTLIMVPKGNPGGITSRQDLSGLTVSVQSGTVHVGQAKRLSRELEQQGMAPLDILVLPTEGDCQLALKSGKAQAHFTDGPLGAYVAKTVGDGSVFEVVQDPSAPNGYDPAPIGIAVSKKAPELTQAIRQALQQLIDDGTYLNILEKYGAEPVAVSQATVNAGQ